MIICGTGGCETVQLSPQSRFLGLEVALIGVVGYTALLALALLALHSRFAGAHWPLKGLAALKLPQQGLYTAHALQLLFGAHKSTFQYLARQSVGAQHMVLPG